MRGCLQSLGRPLPTTNLDLIASLFWGLLRQLLHRSGFCRLMEWKAASLWRALSDHDIKLSARDASVIYHKLLQLHLTGLYLSHRPLPQTAPTSLHRSILVTVIYHKLLQLHLTGLYLSSTTNCSNFTSQVYSCHLPQTAPTSPHRSILVTVIYHKLLQLHLTGLYLSPVVYHKLLQLLLTGL